jgi:hypothetical protein
MAQNAWDRVAARRQIGEKLMLEMRKSCERCKTPLPMDSIDAMICSYECTFCEACVSGPLNGHCPNCGGNLQPRPKRIQK